MSDEEAAVLTRGELENVRKLIADNQKLKDDLQKAEQEIATLAGAQQDRVPAVIFDQQSQAKTPVMKEGMSYSQFKFDMAGA